MQFLPAWDSTKKSVFIFLLTTYSNLKACVADQTPATGFANWYAREARSTKGTGTWAERRGPSLLGSVLVPLAGGGTKSLGSLVMCYLRLCPVHQSLSESSWWPLQFSKERTGHRVIRLGKDPWDLCSEEDIGGNNKTELVSGGWAAEGFPFFSNYPPRFPDGF